MRTTPDAATADALSALRAAAKLASEYYGDVYILAPDARFDEVATAHARCLIACAASEAANRAADAAICAASLPRDLSDEQVAEQGFAWLWDRGPVSLETLAEVVRLYALRFNRKFLPPLDQALGLAKSAEIHWLEISG